MKLRYYMRGLGIGIIVTALIMGLTAGDGRPLTDAEIRAAARELGMVEGDSLKLTDIQPSSVSEPTSMPVPDSEGTSDSEETKDPEGTPDSEETEDPEDTPDPEETKDPEDTSDPAEAETPDSEAGPTPTPNQTSAPEDSTAGENSDTVTIVVLFGSSSRTVCDQLAEAGLVEDAADYDRFLCDNGYSKRICAGTYEIALGASWEEIAKIITKQV